MQTLKVEERHLFDTRPTPTFPQTRFQGSKQKLVDWIWEHTKSLKFNTVLDAFGGTGCIAYLFKTRGKQVTYNDLLKFNYLIGLGLIENDKVKLNQQDLEILLMRHPHIHYRHFIEETFKDIYYTDEENQWLDIVVQNIHLLKNKYKEALAYFALFQACIIKRPFNLFHRKNLYLRFRNVKRNFGNKATWDTPFEEHFLKFVDEANAAVFSNNKNNTALNLDVFALPEEYDLVYIDTPYLSNKKIGVNYLEFYHFLEGLADYNYWRNKIDYDTKNKRFKSTKSVWCDPVQIYDVFNKLFAKFKKSILVVSYRSDEIPAPQELKSLLLKYKDNARLEVMENYKYVLSNDSTSELLFIAT
ncbi:MAG: DNA adenine methylase [Candidatus Omnitrophica bacterium]|nr:DNA adenine methylase [Candidatus Omnitrophota bacterium]